MPNNMPSNERLEQVQGQAQEQKKVKKVKAIRKMRLETLLKRCNDYKVVKGLQPLTQDDSAIICFVLLSDDLQSARNHFVGEKETAIRTRFAEICDTAKMNVKIQLEEIIEAVNL